MSKAGLVALAIFVIALGFRAIGLGWGLPNENRLYTLHPDEPINIGYSRGIEPARLDFTSDFYNYGTLFLTSTRISSDIALTATGATEDSFEGQRAMLLGPRWYGAILGALTATAIAGFFALRGRWIAAWTSGLLVAVGTGLTVHSRFGTVDVPATAFLTFGILAAASAYDSTHSRRWVLWAATLVGLATACKYNMALGILGVFVALGTLPKEKRFLTGALAFALFFGVFLIGTPGVILEPQAFKRDFQYELTHSASGHGLVFEGTTSGFLFHLSNLVVAMEPLTLLAGIVGLGLAVRAKMSWVWIVLAFALPYYLLIGRAEVKFFRYVLPLVPLIAMGFGEFLEQVAAHAKGQRFAVVGAILGVGMTLMHSLPLAAGMARSDPRDQAGAYLRTAAADRTVGIVMDPWFWTAALYPEVNAHIIQGPARRFGWLAGTTSPRVIRYVPEESFAGRTDFDPRLITEVAPHYIVVSSLELYPAKRLASLEGLLSPEAKALADRYREFKRLLDERYVPDRTFGGAQMPLTEDMEYVRPTVYVWKLKTL